MLFKRIVSGLQVFALVFVLVTAVLLVVRQPPPSTVTSGASGATTGPGATLFAANCASCHGPQGQGGLGPPLMGQVTVIYPDVADQVAVVADGKGSMPGFSGSLSAEQIRQIVDFTRADPAGVAAGTPDGKAIYLDQCAACHGDFGEGTYGPAFKGGLAAQRFPNPSDQRAVVLTGRAGTSMRGFADKLTPAEVEAVVDYTRSL